MGDSRPSDGRGASQRRSRERRDQLLHAALTLLERDGAKALTHRAVSEEAGLPPATAGYYFPAIDDLLTEALAAHAAERVAWLREQLDSLGDEVWSPATMAEVTAERVARGQLMTSVADYQVFLVAARRESFRPTAAAIRRDLEDLTIGYLARIGVVNVAHAARAHLALVDGFGLQQLAFGPEAVHVPTVAGAIGALFEYHRATDAEREHQRDLLREPFAAGPQARPAGDPPIAAPVHGRGASQQRSRERREQLLEAAIPLLESGGAKAVTHRAVSHAAGLPPATAGYYFPAIGELLTEAVDFHVRGRIANLARMMESIRDAVVSPLDLIELSSRYLAQGASGIGTTHFELFVEAARNPDFRPIAAATRRVFLGFAMEQLDRLGVTDPHGAARVYLAYVDGLALHRLAFGGGDEADIAVMVDSLVALVHHFRA